ncbi:MULTISPECIES: DUF2017 family protein [unclassified Microbacterium]|uniref:DUF2017 family protein n=1 Tax=unclassified Microbacterium TaxID=2609290 RepID=UPI00344378C8
MSATIAMRMARIEGIQLSRLVDDFVELVGSDRDLSDPAVNRLAPDAYPGDAEAAREFREATRADLFDRRLHDAEVVRHALSAVRADDELTEAEAFVELDVTLTAADADAWLRTLAALRLVIAARLGIERDDDHDPEDARFGIYDWLGYRLEVIVQAADELDGS